MIGLALAIKFFIETRASRISLISYVLNSSKTNYCICSVKLMSPEHVGSVVVLRNKMSQLANFVRLHEGIVGNSNTFSSFNGK